LWQLGRQDNCQVAVLLSIANHHTSFPIAWQLYLPENWINDAERRKTTGVPADMTFQTKPQIALKQIEHACEAGIARGVALMDAGYGADTDLRDGITILGLLYTAGIGPNTSVWAPGTAPLPPKPWSGQGRPTTRLRRDAEHQPERTFIVSDKRSLPSRRWR
jgi:SRSO17 transposase